VYVDTVGDAERYRSRLSSFFPGLSFTVCPKADALYPIVSGASIVAKVLRDTSLQVWKQGGRGGLISLSNRAPVCNREDSRFALHPAAVETVRR